MSLNQEQQEAVAHVDGPLLVLAGAGSGKTRIVTRRIVQLIKSGVEPDSILAVTFTNKAAGEMQDRVYELTGGRGLTSYPTICTFHSLGSRILRESVHHLGFSNAFVIYDEEDSNKLLRGCMNTLKLKRESSLLKSFRGLISRSKDLLQDPTHADVPNDVREVYALYQTRLQEADALDFDDLLYLTVRLFNEHPDIRAHYQQRWPYLLIDEYQDTNEAQYTLARLIVEHTHNIFVVGDPDQSIYSWRGANIGNILNFENDYPGARIVRLEQNYRSRKNILDAANSLIQHNHNRYEKNLWSDRGDGEKILLHIAGTEKEEASFLVHEIERLHTFYQIPFSDMAVFYRTNFQSRVLEDFLLRKRLPYVIVGGLSFYRRKEIKDILAFLHMVHSDHDTIAFTRTLNLPKRGIGEATIEKLLLEGRDNLFAFCQAGAPGVRLNAKQKAGLKEYVELIENLRNIQGDSLKQLVIETVRQSRYLDVLREDKETYDDRKENIEELVSKAAEWESNSLVSFLEELSLKSSLDEAETDEDKLNLMTIHNGKGLEFNTVFLVGLEEDLFPHANSRNDYESLEEERRLCYVGMTRAKERLYLSAAETRFLWGTYRRQRPSRFLREIPREYMEKLE